MPKSPEVLCLGEMLVDKICTTPGMKLSDVTIWNDVPGGAPANTTVANVRLGVSTSFLGGFAPDEDGEVLLALLKHEGVDVSGSAVIPGTETRKVYVLTTSNGDRQFADFTRTNCADAAFSSEHLFRAQGLFETAHIFHHGSISLIDSTSEGATLRGITLSKSKGLLRYYDPNVRKNLWASPGDCRHAILLTLTGADIVKVSADELEFLSDGDGNLHVLAQQFRRTHGITVLLLTLGEKGAMVFNSDGYMDVPGFDMKDDFVEATGAGDAFNAGFQSSLLTYLKLRANFGLSRGDLLTKLNTLELGEMVRYANMIGALACTKIGAIPAMPTLSEFAAFAEAHP